MTFRHLVLTPLVAMVISAALVGVGLVASSADAAAVPRVKGVTSAGQKWYQSKLKVRWKPVRGARYQVRWAYKQAALPRARAVTTSATSMYSPTLNDRCRIWYVQVRAVKSGRVGRWSPPKRVRFVNRTPRASVYSTHVQTATNQAQIRWKYTSFAAKYRVRWSAAPYEKWLGFDNFTGWSSQAARAATISLPASPRAGDRFLHPAYGNPIYAQVHNSNGCSRATPKSSYFPVFPKPLHPGNASTGYPLAVGSYNVELFPTGATTKMTNLASNIASKDLDVVLLQEATGTTANSLVAALGRQRQSDWAAVTVGQSKGVNQQILYRKSEFTERESGSLGRADDANPATPLPTPWARLAPVGQPSSAKSILVVSVHLERSSSSSAITQKLATHQAASVLVGGIAAKNTAGLPVVAGGDFQGNFGAFCDESSRPACAGEGQPTFVRAGFWDTRGAVTKRGIRYGTVNKHLAKPPAAHAGVGGRADFILVKGFPGVSHYENVVKTYGDASKTYQSDHNLIFAKLFVPFSRP